jgi:hypothetical protein
MDLRLISNRDNTYIGLQLIKGWYQMKRLILRMDYLSDVTLNWIGREIHRSTDPVYVKDM